MKKYIKLYEEFTEDINIPVVGCTYYEKDDFDSPYEWNTNSKSMYLIDAVNEISTIVEEFSIRPDDLAGISLELWGSNRNCPNITYVSHITNDIFKLPNLVDKKTWLSDAYDTMTQSVRIIKKSYKLNKPILSILKGYENKTYVANPLWNQYWEEGLTKLVTEICPLEECDQITRREIGNFALANQMTSILKYCIDKKIDIGLSKDVLNIAGEALKGNHKLR